MIGHLQRNKIDQVLPIASKIHAVDSVRLLDALEAAAAKRGAPVSVLLEVNASGEATKHGFAPAEVSGLGEAIGKLRHVRVLGLMTMAAPAEDPEECRPTFRTLQEPATAWTASCRWACRATSRSRSRKRRRWSVSAAATSRESGVIEAASMAA